MEAPHARFDRDTASGGVVKDSYHNTLSTYVEVISDDFQSTFTVVDENTLSNMLGFPKDFYRVVNIIRNYIPEVPVFFSKTNQLDGEYDVYLITIRKPNNSMQKYISF